ncbi:MAG: tRNA (adenosine(37)-N6)-threonylcarbamoyltransferase complex ATPase subunit type 1 TsaE [Desulfosarcinaceae bacterium]
MRGPTARLDLATRSPGETRRLAAAIGRLLRAGSLLLIEGDLGAGKTVFAQGLARGLDVPAEYAITSPTYTLVHEYPGRERFYHVDLYRLPPGGADLESLGLSDQAGVSGVVLIEWPDRLPPEELPPEHLRITLTAGAPHTRTVGLIGYGLPYIDLIEKSDFSRQ